MAPKVSVVMAAYNHAPFVGHAVQSVLSQTFSDFELLVSDDGSRDGTGDVIRQFSDNRVRFHPNPENRGACVVTNELIQRASGDYIAILNSDDYWAPEKLTVQVNFMEGQSECAAQFTRVIFVDKTGTPLPTEGGGFRDVFHQSNRSRGQWLRRFFDGGNCLCHPSVLIRRNCYSEIGLYDNRYRQLPDFDMWIRLIKRHSIHVSDQRLVYFRLMPGENVSSHTEANVVRASNEHYLIAGGFFDDVDKSVLIDGFADLMVFENPPSLEHCEIEKTLLYFTPNRWFGHVHKAVGLRRLFNLFRSPLYRSVLIEDYRIDELEFQRRTATSHAFRQPLDPSTISRAELFSELKRRALRRLRRQFRRPSL